MTLAEIRASDKTLLLAKDVAPVLGCDPHSIRIQAHEYPEGLGFPVVLLGNRTLIPRKRFLEFLGEEEDKK